MDNIEALTGKLLGVYTEQIDLKESFIALASKAANLPGTTILLSGGELDCARYHILGTKPWLSLKSRRERIELTGQNKTLRFNADPFDTVKDIMTCFKLDQRLFPAPMASGLLGYFAYDLKDCLENLPRTSVDTFGLPHLCLFAPSIIVIHDKKTEKTSLCIAKRNFNGKNTLDNDLEFFNRMISSTKSIQGSFSGNSHGFKSCLKKADYLDSISKIKEYIKNGHVYQVNMAQRFEMDFQGDPFTLFLNLFEVNPAPFFAYMNCNDHHIVSTSPERFILQDGDRVETRPIKGTRPRCQSASADKKMASELLESKKDDAELSMIVDLLRNDLGKVCQTGSVRVREHKRIERYQNVYHLISVVEGKLSIEYNAIDIIKASFPGGSITGCPKIRAMEIIDELEPVRRHIYTGSIGYISFHDTMDLSIAIRTATIHKNKIILSVGGGIVFDSDPEDEYDETIHKGRTFMEAFNTHRGIDTPQNHIWMNGSIIPQNQGMIPVSDLGVQYGYGFFETIRVDNNKPQHFKEHIARFDLTWRHLFENQEPPDLTWEDIIKQVIIENDLENETAAIKIIATRGNDKPDSYNGNLLVIARPYSHRLADKKEPGLNLGIYPYPRQTPLADHKTLNYLYYLMAGKWAKLNGTDEALILNPDKSLSETNTGNIILIKGKEMIIPASSHVLPGVTQKIILRFMMDKGYNYKEKKVVEKDLFEVDQVLISNSLMGVVPALSVDSKRLDQPSELWREINNAIFD